MVHRSHEGECVQPVFRSLLSDVSFLKGFRDAVWRHLGSQTLSGTERSTAYKHFVALHDLYPAHASRADSEYYQHYVKEAGIAIERSRHVRLDLMLSRFYADCVHAQWTAFLAAVNSRLTLIHYVAAIDNSNQAEMNAVSGAYAWIGHEQEDDAKERAVDSILAVRATNHF